MDLGDGDSLRGVVARLRDAAADVDRMRGRAAQAIDTQEAQAGPGADQFKCALWDLIDSGDVAVKTVSRAPIPAGAR